MTEFLFLGELSL